MAAKRFPIATSPEETDRNVAPRSLKVKIKWIEFRPVTWLMATLIVVTGVYITTFEGLTERVGY